MGRGEISSTGSPCVSRERGYYGATQNTGHSSHHTSFYRHGDAGGCGGGKGLEEQRREGEAKAGGKGDDGWRGVGVEASGRGVARKSSEPFSTPEAGRISFSSLPHILPSPGRHRHCLGLQSKKGLPTTLPLAP